MAVRIEVLRRSHRLLGADFQNQHPSLVEYLERYAVRHAEKDLLAGERALVPGALEAPDARQDAWREHLVRHLDVPLAAVLGCSSS